MSTTGAPRRRRRGIVPGTVGLVAALLAGCAAPHGSGAATAAARGRAVAADPAAAAAAARYLAPGSRPEVLPGPVLIADEENDRLIEVDTAGRIVWRFPQPGDLRPGEVFKSPDDAFFTPDGRQIIATEENFSVVTLIDRASRRILWRYGTPGQPGSSDNHLSNPDDAIVLPDGHILTADIKNCRILLLTRGQPTPTRIIGTTTSACRHAPPVHWGSPNGAFPLSNGHYLVTEINGDWVDEIDLAGHVFRATHPPGVAYPSDTNEVTPGVWLTVDYSKPGSIETFDPSGRLLWRYAPLGAGQELSTPSLAAPLPNGDVIANDDANDRVIVVDPHTNQIVWQYGHYAQDGSGPGYLGGPDGLDLAPPYSELMRHAATG